MEVNGGPTAMSHGTGGVGVGLQQHDIMSPSLTSGFSGSGGDCKSTETSSILSAASYTSATNRLLPNLQQQQQQQQQQPPQRGPIMMMMNGGGTGMTNGTGGSGGTGVGIGLSDSNSSSAIVTSCISSIGMTSATYRLDSLTDGASGVDAEVDLAGTHDFFGMLGPVQVAFEHALRGEGQVAELARVRRGRRLRRGRRVDDIHAAPVGVDDVGDQGTDADPDSGRQR